MANGNMTIKKKVDDDDKKKKKKKGEESKSEPKVRPVYQKYTKSDTLIGKEISNDRKARMEFSKKQLSEWETKTPYQKARHREELSKELGGHAKESDLNRNISNTKLDTTHHAGIVKAQQVRTEPLKTLDAEEKRAREALKRKINQK